MHGFGAGVALDDLAMVTTTHSTVNLARRFRDALVAVPVTVRDVINRRLRRETDAKCLIGTNRPIDNEGMTRFEDGRRKKSCGMEGGEDWR